MRMIALLAATVFVSSVLSAEPAVVPDRIPCVRDLETKFFFEPLVNQGLSFYGVREELWLPINIALQRNSASVPDRMKTATAFMIPNPLEYPMQKGAVAKILKEVLLAVFLESMSQYGVNQRPFADRIFEYIFAQQSPLFIRCFGEEAKKLLPPID